MSALSDHAERKGDHLDLAATDQVAFTSKTTLFDQVYMVHDALPELRIAEVDLETRLAGERLRAPLVIAAMTGGLDRAAAVNRDLATVAQELGIGFGFGSMRPLLEDGVTAGYLVRDVAPDAVIFGNIGVVQALRSSTSELARMLDRTGCNALCVHLNPAQEVVQPGGDDDFTGGLGAIERLVRELDRPVIVKETGCGLSRSVGRRLAAIGVVTVDVGGAGGTSWVGVETLRARARSRAIGERFWDWGIPTAASVAQLDGLDFEIIATGGVRHGLDVARAIALGATAGGMARPFLQAWNAGGIDAVAEAARTAIEEIRIACVLTGCGEVELLGHRPVVLGPELLPWVPADARVRDRLANGLR